MEITIVHNSTIPLHTQLLEQLRHLILSGQWAPGSRLPSETELQRELKISRSTVRQALSNAEAEGLIERVPGRGTFVAHLPSGRNPYRQIGYVTVDLLNSDLQYQLLSGAESAARNQGYQIVFCNSENDIDEENKLLDQLLKDKVGGILIWPHLTSDPSRRLFQLTNQGLIPVVLMDRTLPNLMCDYVTSDNYTGAYTAIEHLVHLRHQRIAFLSHPVIQLSTISERLRGYRDALQNVNLTPMKHWLIGHADQELKTDYALNAYGQGSGQEIEQIAQYLERPQRPTAIFTINDLMALLVLKAASLVGLRIPDDLSVVGFDDMDLAAHLEVPLTTVAQDGFALGRQAIKLLIERIEGYQGLPRQEMLPTQLKIRASTVSLTTSQVSEKLSQSTR